MNDSNGNEIKHGDKLLLDGGSNPVEIEAVMMVKVPWLDDGAVPLEAYVGMSFCTVTIVEEDE